MAINPADITTVQVSELPPNPISLIDFGCHQVGDILSRHTMQELVDFIRGQSAGFPYEIKLIRAPNTAYITDNFDMIPGSTQGLGKNLWLGWALCNGNNGTDNDDGITYIGYGANNLTIGEFTGSSTHTLTESQLPSVSKNVTLPVSDADNGGGSHIYVMATDTEAAGNKTYTNAITFGGGLSHNNMQPSKVMLKIMKLP